MQYHSQMGVETPPPNGHVALEATTEVEAAVQPAALAPQPSTTARVDTARGVFITSRGSELVLTGKQVSSLMLERVAAEGKPRVPMIEVTLLGKHKQLEANPNDPNYQAALKDWQEESNLKTMRYLFLTGVKGQPDEAFIEEHRAFFPNASEAEMKYLWVASRIPDEDIELFIEAVMGQTRPTEQGVAEAANFTT